MLTFYFLHFQYEETLSGEENNVVNGRNCIDQCQRVISEYPSLNDHPSSIGMNANLPYAVECRQPSGIVNVPSSLGPPHHNLQLCLLPVVPV